MACVAFPRKTSFRPSWFRAPAVQPKFLPGNPTNLGIVSSLHRFTMAKEAEFHEIDPDFMKSARIS
jgi:hypothetical protein